MVMELLGENISELRRRQPNEQFSMLTTLKLGMQMLVAIEAVHDLGYLHRDIKPVCLLLSFSPSPSPSPSLCVCVCVSTCSGGMNHTLIHGLLYFLVQLCHGSCTSQTSSLLFD
jgi:serine/threonine protein kinase